MTSQFIQQNNQNLLWKIINNTPQMIDFFGGSASGEKERWFQQVIRHVYENNLGPNSNLGIRELNRVAIDLMVDLLKKAKTKDHLQTKDHMQTKDAPIENLDNHQKPHVINKPGTPLWGETSKAESHVASSMETQFELRRKEYENMIKKTVPVPNFTENVKDEAINDIGMAVNEYMKQREQDSKLFSPKEPLAPMSIEVIETVGPLDIEEIDSNFSGKKVKWGENVEHVYSENGSKVPSELTVWTLKDPKGPKNPFDQTVFLTSIAQILESLGALSKKVDEQSELIRTLIENK